MRTIKTLRITLACLILTVAGLAQTASTGAVTGTVSDSNGAVVAGARLKVTNETTGAERSVVTSENGSFTVPLLSPGSYRLEFSSAGFKKSVKTGLQINVTETARFDVRFEVGAVTEEITVTSEAELLQTESSSLGRVADSVVVSNLPLVSRNYTQIVTLSAGISAGVTRGDELGRGSGGMSGGNFRSHGAFGADNNFQMNGVQSNDLQSSGNFSGGVAVPNPDAIQEFKVQTGQYDATYGRNAGANAWPPKQNVTARSLYFQEKGGLSFEPSKSSSPFDSYVSDPANPVPYRQRPITLRTGWSTWQVNDQRFASDRPDVLSWETEVLTEDITVSGKIMASLFASTSGTDSDWIVKLIDVYPEGYTSDPTMSGYELMIAGDVLRGRYRNSLEKPQPIPANVVQHYKIGFPANDHVFKKGHRIKVQVQSSWFPLIDRNPQKFVPNIYLAKEGDFQRATQRVYRAGKQASHIALPVVGTAR